MHHTPETEAYGISSFTYRTARPFDAEKLWAFVNDGENWKDVLRSKGFFWLAADADIAYELAQAGGINSVSPAGSWWAAVSREHWAHPAGERPDEQPGWDAQFGDRKQQLVFIGQGMDEDALRARLDACLLDPHIVEDRETWSLLPNPFPRASELVEEEEPA